MKQSKPRPTGPTTLRARLASASWRDLLAIAVPTILVIGAVAWFSARSSMRLAPPNVIRFISGPEGSSYRRQADRYQKIIEKYGVKVQVVESRGALDNLERLANPKEKLDVGFVQGGLAARTSRHRTWSRWGRCSCNR